MEHAQALRPQPLQLLTAQTQCNALRRVHCYPFASPVAAAAAAGSDKASKDAAAAAAAPADSDAGEPAKRNLLTAADSTRRFGWLSFWSQLTLSVVSCILFAFSVAFAPTVTPPACDYPPALLCILRTTEGLLPPSRTAPPAALCTVCLAGSLEPARPVGLVACSLAIDAADMVHAGDCSAPGTLRLTLTKPWFYRRNPRSGSLLMLCTSASGLRPSRRSLIAMGSAGCYPLADDVLQDFPTV